MKTIKPSKNQHSFPRNAVPSIECRKRDLIIRIADWTRTKEEPAYDVEVYIGGIYDFNESQTFVVENKNKQAAKDKAVKFANFQTQKLL